MNQYPALFDEVVELPNCLSQLADRVAVAVNEFYASPDEAVAVGGAIGPAGQRQDTLDARAPQRVKPSRVVAVSDGDIACDPVQIQPLPVKEKY